MAAQKADFVLGPVFVGLYWVRRRPESRFGPLLIGVGFVWAGYILQSSGNHVLFGVGAVWEIVIYLGSLVLILTFPTGRLEGRVAKLILITALLGGAVPGLMFRLLTSHLAPEGSISSCRALCPINGLAITEQPALALQLVDVTRGTVIAVALATGGLLIWRLVTGTPPQRRALAIGAPIALLFLLMQVMYHGLKLTSADATVLPAVQWIFAATRSSIWYGFLFALIAAQLFAVRVLQSFVQRSLRRPSRDDLEAMLRDPLGDPGLRLVFWNTKAETWDDAGADGAGLQPPEPGSGRGLAIVERDGRPAVAIIHDAQLNDDPELLQTAGAIALLAAENAELDAAWNDALQELRQSRARIIVAGDSERRKLERNLHDGVQQRLTAVRIRLGLTNELVAEGTAIRSELDWIGQSVIAPLAIRAAGIGRHPAELESAVYYCCLEAIQNATKHGGPAVHISVTLSEDADELRFEVTDDGRGFNPSEAHLGTGLQNMRDRLGALDGRLALVTAASHGTVVSGFVPLRGGQSIRHLRRSGHVLGNGERLGAGPA